MNNPWTKRAADRPAPVEETELNYLSTKTWIPRKNAPDLKIPNEIKIDASAIPTVIKIETTFNHFEPEKTSNEFNWEEQVPMGFGGHPLAAPHAVLPRAFRFTMESKNMPMLKYLVKDASINRTGNHVCVSLYETSDLQAEKIIDGFKGKAPDVYVTALDGCGKKLFAYKLTKPKLHTHSTPLDYASSDILTHHIVLTYDSCEVLSPPQK